MSEQSDYQPGGKKLTGRSVLAMLVAFFTVMLLANAIMARYAIKTFSGLDADNPYDSGLAYNREIEAAKAQAELGWRVDLTRTREGPATAITVTAKDRDGRPLIGVEVSTRFMHPANRKLDQVVAASETAEGVYKAGADLTPGHWEVLIDISRDGARLFRTDNQIDVE